jgi:hypothetical protein
MQAFGGSRAGNAGGPFRNWKQFEILRRRIRDQFRVSGNFVDLVHHRAVHVCGV